MKLTQLYSVITLTQKQYDHAHGPHIHTYILCEYPNSETMNVNMRMGLTFT